ncbi:MAG: membrane integrity-associated transporter subunit PqiC [Pseudomonadales bacterium]|nr:membrane integrity-associated transporter subunit PqiC [Pseudomonadales bacterium]
MRLLCLLAAALLAACSSTPPQTSSYLLRAEVPASSGSQLASSTVALADIRVATYIEQPGLVLATGDGKVHAARNHQWAEPLQVSLRRFLANEVSGASGLDVSPRVLPSTTTRVSVTVDQLHGDGQGAALLVAYWEVDNAGDVRFFEFSQRQSLASAGYDALAHAEQALLGQLAQAIADSLKSG